MEDTSIWTTVGAGIASLVTGVMLSRAKWSRDSTVIANESAARDMLDRLVAENDKLKLTLAETFQQYNALIATNAKTVGMVAAFEERQKLMQDRMDEMKTEIQRLNNLLSERGKIG